MLSKSFRLVVVVLVLFSEQFVLGSSSEQQCVLSWKKADASAGSDVFCARYIHFEPSLLMADWEQLLDRGLLHANSEFYYNFQGKRFWMRDPHTDMLYCPHSDTEMVLSVPRISRHDNQIRVCDDKLFYDFLITHETLCRQMPKEHKQIFFFHRSQNEA